MNTLPVYGYRGWWKNFLDYCFDVHKLVEQPRPLVTEMIVKELVKYNAELYNLPGSAYLNFKTEQDITLFLLRWS